MSRPLASSVVTAFAVLPAILLAFISPSLASEECAPLAPNVTKDSEERLAGEVEGEIEAVFGKLLEADASIKGNYTRIITDSLRDYKSAEKVLILQHVIYLGCVRAAEINISELFYLIDRLLSDSNTLGSGGTHEAELSQKERSHQQSRALESTRVDLSGNWTGEWYDHKSRKEADVEHNIVKETAENYLVYASISTSGETDHFIFDLFQHDNGFLSFNSEAKKRGKREFLVGTLFRDGKLLLVLDPHGYGGAFDYIVLGRDAGEISSATTIANVTPDIVGLWNAYFGCESRVDENMDLRILISHNQDRRDNYNLTVTVFFGGESPSKIDISGDRLEDDLVLMFSNLGPFQAVLKLKTLDRMVGILNIDQFFASRIGFQASCTEAELRRAG